MDYRLKLIIEFTAFYWDNYQGGSGKYVDEKMTLSIDESLPARLILDKVKQSVEMKIKMSRPLQQDKPEYSITKIEVAF